MEPDELRALATEYIRTEVARGRLTCALIVDNAADYLHGEGDPAELRSLAWQIVPELFGAHLAEQSTWPDRTDSDRLTDAFRALDAVGVVAREDFVCCQNCGVTEIGAEVLETDEARGYVFYHGQDAERAAAGGGLWLAYGTFDGQPATQIGEEVAAALRAEGLHVDWDGSASRRIHVRLHWARRRHGRMAAFVGDGQATPEVAVTVSQGSYGVNAPMSVTALARLELPWLPTGVSLRIGDGPSAPVVHREHDRLVSDDGRAVGRFDGLRLIDGGTGGDVPSEPGLLEVTFTSRPTGPSDYLGRPMILAESIDTLRRLPTRTDSWLSAAGRSGDIVQMRWEGGRLWLETPHSADGTHTGKYASLAEAEQMLAILATEDRSAVGELDGVTTQAW